MGAARKRCVIGRRSPGQRALIPPLPPEPAPSRKDWRSAVMISFTGRTLAEMKEAVIDANCDESIGVVVITGAGDRAFCAGGDIKWLSEAQQEGRWGHGDFDPHAGIEECLKPIIARANGST